MSMYYLMAQLPSLDGIGENAPPPITEERFHELCHCFLGKKAQRNLDRLTLAPPRNFEKSGSSLINAWNTAERDLRLALGKMRAEQMQKNFDAGDAAFPVGILQAGTHSGGDGKPHGSREIPEPLPSGIPGNAQANGYVFGGFRILLRAETETDFAGKPV